MSAHKGLGRGLDTLIPTSFDTTILRDSERIEKLPINKVKPNPDQPRKHFDETALTELAESIKAHGIVQPMVVTQVNDEYRIIAGERRFRAAQIAGLTEVPAVVRTMEDLEELEIALIENVQRVDLSPLEQAESIQRLHEQFSIGYADIAQRLGKASTTVNNIVRLLGLPDTAKKALSQGEISEGHARSVLALKDDPAKQQELLESIIEKGWSVRQAEQFVTATKQKGKATKVITEHMARTTPQTEVISKKLGTPVTLRRTAKGGRIEIHFSSDEELQKITQQLS